MILDFYKKPVWCFDGGGGNDSNDNDSNDGWFDDRDGDGIPNIGDFNDGEGWLDTNPGGDGGSDLAPDTSPRPPERPDPPSTGGGDDDDDGGSEATAASLQSRIDALEREYDALMDMDGDDRYTSPGSVRAQINALQSELDALSTSTPTPETFNEAFARNRAEGNATFEWNGQTYTTQTAEEADTESWSDPGNWEVVTTQNGDIDLSYTGDRTRPSNGNYTVPSVAEVLNSGGGNATGYSLTTEGGTVYFESDKYGITGTNAEVVSQEERSIDRAVERYNDPDNWRIDADNRGDPVLSYVGGGDLPPTEAFTGGYVNVPGLLDVDAAQEEQGITGYLDLESVGGEIMVVDDYGALHENADQAALNEIKANEYQNPSNWNVSLDSSGRPSVVLDPGSSNYDLGDVDWGDSSAASFTPSATAVKNEELASSGANYRISYDEDSGYTQVLSAVDGAPLGSFVTFSPDQELASAMADAYNRGYSPNTPEFDTMVDATLGVTIPEGGLERSPTTGEIASDTGRAFFTGFADTFANSLKGVSVAKRGWAEANAEIFGKNLESLGQRLAETQEKLFSATDPNVIAALDNHIKTLQGEIAITTKDFERMAERQGIPVDDDFWYGMGAALSAAAANSAGEIENGDNFVVQLGGGFGSALGFITSAAGATALGGPVAGTMAAASLGSLGNSAAVYDEAKASGATEAEALATAKMGLLIGSTEAIPIGKVLGNLPPNFADYFVGRLAKRGVDFVEEGVVEGVQEAMTSVLNDLAAKGIYDPQRQVFTGDLTRDALIGFIVGGTTNTALGAVFDNKTLVDLADLSDLTVEELEVAINNPDLYLDLAPDNKIDPSTVEQLLADGMNISEVTQKFQDVTGSSANPDGTTIEVLANQSSFGDTKVVDGSGSAAIVYGEPGSNKFSAQPTSGSVGSFVNIENPFTIDGINNDSGFQALADLFGEGDAQKIQDEYNSTGTVTIDSGMQDTLVDNGYDGVINNDTGEVTVTDPSNVSTVSDDGSTTGGTIVATRPEWKNEIDSLYNTYGGINLDEAQSIASQYNVPITEFNDYYKEMVQVNQPWKQAVLDNYLMNGRVDFDTVKQIQQDFDVAVSDFYDFYEKLSVSSADGLLESFQEELATSTALVGTLESELATSNKEISDLESDLASVREDVANLEGQLSDSAALQELTQGEVESLQSQLETKQDRIATLNSRLSKRTNQRNALQSELDTLRETSAEEISTLESELATSNKEISDLEGDLASAREDVADLEGQLSDSAALQELTQGEVESLQSQLETSQERVSTLESTLNTRTDQRDTLQSELDTLRESSAEEISTLEGQLDTAQSSANWVNGQIEAGESRADIIKTLKSEGAFSQTEAARLYDSINGFRESISGLEGDVAGLETDVDTLTGERDFAEGAYETVNNAWESGSDRAEIIDSLVENGFDTVSASTLVDTVKQVRDTDALLREEKGFAQGAYQYINQRLAENATRDEVYAELIDGGYNDTTANAALDAALDVYEQKAQLYGDVSFAQGAYALVNTQLDAGKSREEIVQLLSENNFPTDLAQGLVDSVQNYRETITGLEGDVEAGEDVAQFAQQAYDYVNGQLDAETSLDQIVTDLVENGYTESGATALVENISDMRTNLAGVEAELGTAQANQLFGQTAYSFVNEQLELIDADPDGTLTVNDVIGRLVDNGFSEDNAATLVNNVSTIRDTETTLRDQVAGLEAENTFAEGAYDYVNTRLDAMLGQDPDAEVQITPESIVNELVQNGFDQTTAQNLVDSVNTVRDKVTGLGMQLDTLGTEASFAERAYSYVDSMLEDGKTSEEIQTSLVENGFAEDTAATLVGSVETTRNTIGGLETDLGTARDERTFAQRSFDFVNQQLDGDVDSADIIADLVDNGFSETDATAVVTDAVDIRTNTELLNANNAFAQGAYGFIQEQLDSGSKSTDIIQELLDNGFGYDKAQSMVTNVVNVRNEVDTLSDALGVMETRAEFAQTSFDYINNQLDNRVAEDVLLQDLVENYGFTANNAQTLVDSVQDTRFQQAERTRLQEQLTRGTTFDFRVASATAGAPDFGGEEEDEDAVTVDGPFAPVGPRPVVEPFLGSGVFGDGGGAPPPDEGVDDDLTPGIGQLGFDQFGRPLGTYLTQPSQPVGPFDAYAMQMPEDPVFAPQEARLGPQPTEVTLDEAGFVTEPAAYIPEQMTADPMTADPMTYYSPQFNQYARIPVGLEPTQVPASFIQQPLPAINEVTPQGIGAFLGRNPRTGGTT